MVHFRSKNDILHWLEKHCPRKAIVRSLSQNGAELLGGFDPIPPTTRPGWIVKVTSSLGKKKPSWIVAIIPHEGTPTCGIRILHSVPWKNWAGGVWNTNLMHGDKPWLYAIMKERANARI